MKLVNRVSVYFLLGLAIILIVYSGVFYIFVRTRLVQQYESELHGAFNSLVAAVEVEREDVSWQPLEHTIALRASHGTEQVQWAVVGDSDHVIDTSANATADLIAQAQQISLRELTKADQGEFVTSGQWKILFRRLMAIAPDDSHRDVDEYNEIVVIAALSTIPLNGNLNRLLLLVSTLPIATWLVAAAAGHWYCRRALQPVLNMSEQARSITTADFDFRLPVGETRDELADLAESFNTLLDHQHRAFEQQRRFTGDAAHELRTPLTVLLGQIDVALRRTRTSEEYAATLGVLKAETIQLRSIVESLLFLARADQEQIPPDTEVIMLNEWFPEYLQRWNSHVRCNDLHFAIGPVVSTRVNGSRVLLSRLFDNLIGNAIKYSLPGSKIQIGLAGCRDEVVTMVEDEGSGIAAEDVSQVFCPFFRSRAAREAGIAGTGLGLAIAARIAVTSGGRLTCQSELGKGSRFTLSLPVAACEPF